MPFRISVRGDPPQDPAITREQEMLARGRGLRSALEVKASGRLAVVGGGPSLKERIGELRAGFEHVWAVNGTGAWLARNRVTSKFFSVDQMPVLADRVGFAGEAILGTCVHPRVFNCFHSDDVLVFEVYDRNDPREGAVRGWNTTATFAPALALKMGFESVHFFGCDSSFGETSHVDRNEQQPLQVLIKAGGEVYRATLGMMVQAEALSNLIREFPQYLFNHSGGLMKAMLEHPETWEVVGFSDQLKDDMERFAARTGAEHGNDCTV